MANFSTVFVTGGAGYIGSHCIVELLEAGYSVIAIDNFANSVNGEHGEAPSLKRVEQITGKPVTFYQCDLLDKSKLEEIFSKHKIDCVIHFASMKAVGESMQVPLLYYKNNIVGTINLLEVMKQNNCYQLVFSSSCTVYGNPEYLPITEEHPTGEVTNVYGRTKYFIEEMLKDISAAEKNWNIISLRYFNPVGAHPSGLIGEDPTKAFTNLMPYMAQVAIGNKESLTIFGGDYDTVDGTGVRDYIHVMDLASGHVAALDKLNKEHLRLKVYNLGLGTGLSVKELVHEFEEVTGVHIPYALGPRRVGDVDSLVCDGSLAVTELQWQPKYDVKMMCKYYAIMYFLFQTYNLGTGQGVSVLQLLKTFEAVTSTVVPYEIRERRTGDIVSMYANANLAEKELGWKTKYNLEQMCRDFWRWQTMNPNGYRSETATAAKLNGTTLAVNGKQLNGH
ncbi:UDP-glucose 4-epimerase-like isoform X1 [Schistocerca gregaria]|uniref:UDP-glucose 4-epimerase-like isoform X1 n=1 Tax=Schistocerca gregaria TaxID=7010 RepID=UPI00211E5234|nr:UDP-glucose 4-epimerase-like isoform X1 [Schistocerca gregaria]